MIVRTYIKSFKGRKYNPRAKVRVYRNLNRSGHWYSVMQDGRVIGHTQHILLHQVECVINEAGRKRCLATGVKNVHAYLEGYVSYNDTWFRDNEPHLLKDRAGYDPAQGFWIDYGYKFHQDPEEFVVRFGMKRAASVLLSKDGMSVNEPTTYEL